MREAVEATMSSVGTIMRFQRTEDNKMGGGTVTYLPAGTVNCYITQTRRPFEPVIAEKITSVQAFTIDIPVGNIINPNDRFASGGYTYEVVGTNAGVSEAVSVKFFAIRLD
jgi:hypothetical protein